MPYIGNSPGTGTRNRFIYTATASQTTFSGADDNGKTLKYADSDYVDVYLNGICLVPVTDYTSTSKTSIVLTQAASLNDTLEVVAYDIATISDTVSKADGGTFEANVTFAAGADIITATAGTDNVRLGENAGDSIASGGANNVTVGKNAGTAITTGKKATLIGAESGEALVDGDNNTAVGYQALTADTNGEKSVAVGTFALMAQNQSSLTDTHNTAVGYQAGTAITTATRNTVVGSSAGASNQTSLYNTYVGYGAGQSTTGQGNTFIGDASGNSVVAGEFNTLLGQQAGNAITSGDKNTIIGRFTGNDGGLDIRTSSNNIVLSDGDGNPRGVFSSGGNYGVGQVNGLGSVNSATNGAVLGAQGYGMFQRAGSTVGYFNRNTNDGLLISFYGTGTQEGTISISGTTVSYNGGHLSRWSQLADNTKDTSIVKGTVMTNLDQMAVWTHAAKEVGDDILDVDGNVIGQETEAQDAWTEDNEQLNCMAVSSVEGDPNVAGVFVNWDEDDTDFVNDMNVAMTGDMVIRIAQGVTVARGDLLMSAGDGTAKPQGDDIVRSKTIAKVTSTNVSHTYDDGSFLVPCVLMAC